MKVRADDENQGSSDGCKYSAGTGSLGARHESNRHEVQGITHRLPYIATSPPLSVTPEPVQRNNLNLVELHGLGRDVCWK